MAFGIPGSDTTGTNGPFLSRIQFDSRSGFWKIVKRIQNSDGSWSDQESEPFQNPTFLIDLGSFEVGYIKLSSPPAFLLVPYGTSLPMQPEEMVTDAQGRKRKAFAPGCRVKVASPKLFGDLDAYHFSVSARNVLNSMEDLWTKFASAPEAKQGLVPIVSVPRVDKVEIQTKFGTNIIRFPVWEITDWKERITAFGERTVPPPSGKIAQSEQTTSAATNSPPPNHVPPPTSAPSTDEHAPW